MLTKLDLYIIRKFLGTFIYALLLFSVIAIVIDITEKLDDFLEDDIPFTVIVTDYYLNFIPYIDALLGPLFVFISVIFFTSKMAYNSEIIAILNGGISFNRLLVPYMVSAFILAGGLYYANNHLVPIANKGRLDFDYTYFSQPYSRLSNNIHLQVEQGVFIYLENYNPRDSVGYKFALEKMENGKLVTKWRADQIRWVYQKNAWRVKKYYIRHFTGNGEEITKGQSLDTAFAFIPGDLSRKRNLTEEMTSPELKSYINGLIEKGTEGVELFQIEYHRRTSDAFMVIILTLIGVSIASRKVRGGRGLHIGIGFIISATFIVASRFSTTFSTNANLPPLLGVWIPNIFFGLFSIYLLKKTPK